MGRFVREVIKKKRTFEGTHQIKTINEKTQTCFFVEKEKVQQHFASVRNEVRGRP